MTTLGWVRHGTDLTEKDMKLVVNATLQALAKLHVAHLVHRDLRLDNILWKSESEPFLADLELAARENQKVGARITLALPIICSFCTPLGSCSTCCTALPPHALMLPSNIMAEITLVHAGPLRGVFQGLGR